MRTTIAAFAVTLLCIAGSPAAPTPSERIDALIEARLAGNNLAPNPELNDTVFLRRIYLDIAGRIPTIEEAEAFKTDESPDRRATLIDRLLHSEARVSHAYHFWADILRINNQVDGAAKEAYQLWIKQALRENKPYDELVYDLVTARGKTWENGAIGYYLRDRGMPLDNMSNTVRIFLGTRLECAQCHNHPFDKWTQMDYFQMAAFSYGMDTRNYNSANRKLAGNYSNNLQREAFAAAAGREDFPRINKDRLESTLGTDKGRKMLERLGMSEEEFRRRNDAAFAAYEKAAVAVRGINQAAKQLYDPLKYIEASENEKLPKLPHDYQYSDAQPNQVISPSAMFGNEITVPENGSRIEAYARWMTSSENPTFTRVIANRLWKETFGMGVFEPIDEIIDGMEVSNPELMDYLEELMVELDYDMVAFQRVLYNTRTYQREAGTADVFAGDPCLFPGPVLRRMSAEQIWDSIVALALPEADHYSPRLKNQLAAVEKERLIYESLEGHSEEEFIALLNKYAPLLAEAQEGEDKIRSEYYEARESGDEEKIRELKKQLGKSSKGILRDLSDEAYTLLDDSRDTGALLASVGMSEISMDRVNGNVSVPSGAVFTRLPKVNLPEAPAGLDKNQRRAWTNEQKADYTIYTKLISGMARASELESPAPRGHFLREFGQSDREVIENAADSASVPQALNLMNSNIVEALVNRYSTFGSRIQAAGTPEDKTRMIFQAMLTREPTAEELDLVRAEIENEGEAAYEGIVWALLNTQQFMFVQ